MTERSPLEITEDRNSLDLNEPNRYDPLTIAFLKRPSINAITKINSDFSVNHRDFINGNSSFWQQANREVRKLIQALQESKDKDTQAVIGDTKVYISEGKSSAETWYGNTMSLNITLARLEGAIKLCNAIKASHDAQKQSDQDHALELCNSKTLD